MNRLGSRVGALFLLRCGRWSAHRRAGGLILSAIAASVLIFSGSMASASVGLPGRGDPAQPLTASSARYLVLIVLDGARPDYLKTGSYAHIQALAARGTTFTNAMAGLLESETPAAHATLSTGSPPRRTGILGFAWAENNRRFSIFNPQIVRSGAMERIMEQSHVSTIAGLYKARFPGARAVAVSGEKYYAADPLGGPNADAILYLRGTLQGTYAPTSIPAHSPPPQVFSAPGLVTSLKHLAFGQDNRMVTRLALSAFSVMRPRVLLINYPDFDWPLGHVDGGIRARARVKTLMANFDQDLGTIEDAYRHAGILKHTLFVITADHGMSTLKRYIPHSVINRAISRAGTSAPSITYNTAAYVWLKDFDKAGKVAGNIISTHDPGIQSVYYLASVNGDMRYVRAPGSAALAPDSDAANQYLLQTLVNGHQPTLVVFCRKNQTTANPDTHWKGDHGGSSWASQHIPLIISGPGVRRGVVVQAPAQLEDIAPTVLSTMGVRPTGMEGRVLTEAQDQPYEADVADRNAELTLLTPVLHGLLNQENLESPHRAH